MHAYESDHALVIMPSDKSFAHVLARVDYIQGRLQAPIGPLRDEKYEDIGEAYYVSSSPGFDRCGQGVEITEARESIVAILSKGIEDFMTRNPLTDIPDFFKKVWNKTRLKEEEIAERIDQFREKISEKIQRDNRILSAAIPDRTQIPAGKIVSIDLVEFKITDPKPLDYYINEISNQEGGPKSQNQE